MVVVLLLHFCVLNADLVPYSIRSTTSFQSECNWLAACFIWPVSKSPTHINADWRKWKKKTRRISCVSNEPTLSASLQCKNVQQHRRNLHNSVCGLLFSLSLFLANKQFIVDGGTIQNLTQIDYFLSLVNFSVARDKFYYFYFIFMIVI